MGQCSNRMSKAASLNTRKRNSPHSGRHSSGCLRRYVVPAVLAVVLALGSGVGLANDGGPPANANSTVFAPVAVRSVQFDGVSGKTVTVEDLLDRRVSLSQEIGMGQVTYYGAREDLSQTQARMGDIGQELPTSLDLTALRAVAEETSKAYRDRGIGGVRVTITQAAVRRLRDENSDGVLIITVTEGVTAEIGTRGKRIDSEDEWREGDPSHKRITEGSPVQPGDPLEVERVDDYIARLNRQPGRHVEAEVRPGQQAGELALDYLIVEQKPWLIYFQLDNTGTDSTTTLRERFGLRNYNLTGNDDILALDYVTGNFQEVHYLQGSYDFPVGWWETARFKPFASWSSYEGSELGIFSTEFSGDSWQIGGEFKTLIFQRKRLFVDLLLGLRYQHVSAKNTLAGTDGDSGFVLPWIGVEAECQGAYARGNAGLTVEFGFAGADEIELALMGRSMVDDVWGTIRYNASGTLYPERMMDPYWSRQPIHEIYGSIRGQITPGDQRLTPSFMHPIGGFYSVRGYDESLVSGDSAVVASLEYRLHLRRLLWPEENGRVPDWELMFRGILDAGHVMYNNPLGFEDDTTLTSLGVGLDLKIKRNVQARLDMGVPLQTVTSGTESVQSGDPRLHFSVSASY